MVRRPSAFAAVRGRSVPTWWRDAKLGIFVHWTPASVPGFAPVDTDIGDLVRSAERDALADTPYSEWYENSLRFPTSAVSRHHREVYGDRPYETFARDWEAALGRWDPHDWAARLAATGARYVVFVAKHADGYCLWPTGVRHPFRSNWSCDRDVVGEMADAVRQAGLRFGLYYCGGMDWSFEPRPVGSMGDVVAGVPRGAYPAYAEAQVRELIDRYRPSVLWNDVAWPGSARRLGALFGHYYRMVPDGVVNDRWIPWHPLMAVTRSAAGRRLVASASRRQARRDGGLVPPRPPHFDVRTPEYLTFAELRPEPWETVRGMDRSFGFNRASRGEDFIGHDELLWTLVDVAAKGGNLLLNVGPRGGDAQIPDEQRHRLEWLADWLVPHRRALAGTRPWVAPGDRTGEGDRVRYTSRDAVVFAFLAPTGPVATLPDVAGTATTRVTDVAGVPRSWRATAGGLVVELPAATARPGPVVLALQDVVARAPRSAARMGG